MAITSMPVMVPGKFINGSYERSDTTTTSDCNIAIGLIFDVPLSWEIANAFASLDDCESLLLVLSDDDAF